VKTLIAITCFQQRLLGFGGAGREGDVLYSLSRYEQRTLHRRGNCQAIKHAFIRLLARLGVVGRFW